MIDQDNVKEYLAKLKSLQEAALRCIGNLLLTLFYFNYAKEMTLLVCKKAFHRSEELRNCSLAFLKGLLEDSNPATYESKFDIVRNLKKFILKVPERVIPEGLLDIFLRMDIKEFKEVDSGEVDLESKVRQGASKNKLNQGKQAKAKLRKRLAKEIKSDLKEAEAEIDPKRLKQIKHEIFVNLYYLYVKIIAKEKPSKLLPTALRGILNFYHHIDHQFIVDLGKYLRIACERMRLICRAAKKEEIRLSSLRTRILIIKCLVTITTKSGQFIDVDEKDSINELYKILLDIHGSSAYDGLFSTEEHQNLISLIETIFLVRRNFSYETVASFVWVLLHIVTKLDKDEKVLFVYLYLAKRLMMRYSRTSRMLEEDSETSGYKLDVRIEDPQATNALNTSILPILRELETTLKLKMNQRMVRKLTKSEPVHASLSSLVPTAVFEKFFNTEERNATFSI
eukprot:TRINITY_DN6194_c0_g1_i4.p1 TRINITY_DN6194_c0_g1~~TRINITY_DN6194_c0_g1_i4.p1  ORF type:complete len:453 (-),score=111.09 TRINITY_DN6194_c0_g1_i4:115-1473(-)